MKRVLKNILFGLSAAFAPQGPYASILMYHSVGENPAIFTVRPEEFEKQLQYLRAHGYTVLTLSALLAKCARGESLKKHVCLTFDDGYVDNFEVVLPLIEKYSVPVTIFLTTGLAGGTLTISGGITLPLLSEEQIRTMHESGLVEFLPHGQEHLSLDKLSAAEARTEIVSSFEYLQKLLGNVPKIYAYAKGRHTTETKTILREEGFEAAVTVRPGLLRPSSELLSLPRNAVGNDTTMTEFKARLGRAGEWYERIKLWR